jgi:hypothetical protein
MPVFYVDVEDEQKDRVAEEWNHFNMLLMK